jgi:hypothetical protein
MFEAEHETLALASNLPEGTLAIALREIAASLEIEPAADTKARPS